MISWNSTRKRVNRLPEPRDLVDSLVQGLGLTSAEVAAIERQAKLFEKYGHQETSGLTKNASAPQISADIIAALGDIPVALLSDNMLRNRGACRY